MVITSISMQNMTLITYKSTRDGRGGASINCKRINKHIKYIDINQNLNIKLGNRQKKKRKQIQEKGLLIQEQD